MSLPPEKVLLVDDEKRLLDGMRRCLSPKLNIVTATGGAEALELLQAQSDIAVIVADMKMPGMDGIELLKAVRDAYPSVRRLMLTGNSDQETAIAAINEGQVMRFLRKPCDNETLLRAIDHAIEDFRFQTTDEKAEDIVEAVDDDQGAREAFLAMMNHELRTPLSQIIGLAGLLEKSSTDDSEALSLDHLRSIQSSGEHLLMLISRIMEFSRLYSADGPEIPNAQTNIIKDVQDEVERLRERAQRKGVTVSLDSLRRHATVCATSQDVQLAIRELLENALKFSTQYGHISVLIKCTSNNVIISIADDGCGVDPDLTGKIQSPFRLGDESLTRRHEGIGLGLALVSTIASMNQAQFSIAPRRGGGTLATMTFDRTETIAAAIDAVA